MGAGDALLPCIVAAGAGASVTGVLGWRLPQRPALARAAQLLGVAALAATALAWVARWVTAGHLPLFGTYESALSLALAVLAVPLLVPRLRRELWPPCGLAGALLVAHGLRFDPAAYALTISERSIVVDLHAVIAWAAFAALTANAGLAVARLLAPGEAAWRLDRPLAASLSAGFLLHSAMLATGSLYSFMLFGRTWGFDPVESLSLVTWLAYGVLLHLHAFARWEGPRLGRWCLLAFTFLVISSRCIVYFPPASTYHIFDMDRRLHVTGAERGDDG